MKKLNECFHLIFSHSKYLPIIYNFTDENENIEVLFGISLFQRENNENVFFVLTLIY